MPTIYKEKKGRDFSWNLPKREANTKQFLPIYIHL